MKAVLALSVLSVALVGCQSTQTVQQPAPEPVADCYYYGQPDIVAPAWICSPDADKAQYIRQSVGFSGNSAGGIAHQKNLAILQAQKELGDQVKLEILSQIKNKVGTLGVEGSVGATSATSAEINALANVVLEGVETIRSFRGKDGYFYVHVGLPQKVLKQNIENVMSEVEKIAPEYSAKSAQETNADLAADIAAAFGNS